jgi:hypothetical protein
MVLTVAVEWRVNLIAACQVYTTWLLTTAVVPIYQYILPSQRLTGFETHSLWIQENCSVMHILPNLLHGILCSLDDAVQILFRTSAQKMYGRSHEQSVSPSGTAGKGWVNPRAEMSEQCCHHYGHYYSRFTCQLQLMQLQRSSKFFWKR